MGDISITRGFDNPHITLFSALGSGAATTFDHHDGTVEILEVIVSPDSRHKGIARSLIEAVYKDALEKQSPLITGICSSEGGFGLLSSYFGEAHMYQWRQPGGNWSVDEYNPFNTEYGVYGLIYPTIFAPDSFDSLRPVPTYWEQDGTPVLNQLISL